MPLSPVFLRALVFEDLLVNRPEHSEREGSSRSATKGLEEAALGSTEGGSGQTQALSILMLPHLPKSGQRQPEAEEQKHNFHQKDVSCPRMSVSLKLVLPPLGWEHPQIQNGESWGSAKSLEEPKISGTLSSHPHPPATWAGIYFSPETPSAAQQRRNWNCSCNCSHPPGGGQPWPSTPGRGTSDRRVVGTHRPGIPPPGWSVASSSGPGTEPSFGLRSRLSPEGGLRSFGALAAGSTQARGRGKEERWDLGSGELGTKVPGPCASEFQVLGGIQGSSLPKCRKQQQWRTGLFIWSGGWFILRLQCFIRELIGRKDKNNPRCTALSGRELALGIKSLWLNKSPFAPVIPSTGIHPEESNWSRGRSRSYVLESSLWQRKS